MDVRAKFMLVRRWIWMVGCILLLSFVPQLCSHAHPVLATRWTKSHRQKWQLLQLFPWAVQIKLLLWILRIFFVFACRVWGNDGVANCHVVGHTSSFLRTQGRKGRKHGDWRKEREFERGEHIIFLFLCFFCWAAFGDHVTYITYPWIYSMLD